MITTFAFLSAKEITLKRIASSFFFPSFSSSFSSLLKVIKNDSIEYNAPLSLPVILNIRFGRRSQGLQLLTRIVKDHRALGRTGLSRPGM